MSMRINTPNFFLKKRSSLFISSLHALAGEFLAFIVTEISHKLAGTTIYRKCAKISRHALTNVPETLPGHAFNLCTL